jgi:phage RecT family recombinase
VTQAPTKHITVQSRSQQMESVLMEKMSAFIEVAPPWLNGEPGVKRLIRQACISVHRSPDLAVCTAPSICIAVLQAVELGIDLGSARPAAWILPFRDNKKNISEAKLMLGYVGLADIAYREGAVSIIDARVVYANDEFDIDYGNPEKPFTHKPVFTVDEKGGRGQIIGAYARAAIPNSPWPAFEWMDIQDIFKIRESSKSPDSPAWKFWFEEMAKKCPVRRMTKLLPTCPPRLNRALEIDRDSDGLAEAPDPARPENRNSNRLQEVLGTKPAPKPNGNGQSNGNAPELDRRDSQISDPTDGPVEITKDDIPF